jgi:hypothetical protein
VVWISFSFGLDFLSNPSYDWRCLLLGVAKQFLRIVEWRCLSALHGLEHL